MTATQTQFRRGTTAQCEGMTPAEGEAVVDLTLDTWRMGDGSRAGGFIMPNFNHIQMQTFQFAVAGGTGNAITITLSPVPLSLSQPLKVKFKATATNTGATTVNVNSLGAVNILKMASGSLTALVAGDIVSGGIYEIAYDGTQFQLLTVFDSGLTSVSQGDLNTSTGTFSDTAPATPTGSQSTVQPASTEITLPGGQYGFTIGCHSTSGRQGGWVYGNNDSSGYPNKVRAYVNSDGAGGTIIHGRQRYITSSPPFDLGDGEAGGFIFAMIDGAGEIISHYAADVPPWGYNGPTDIMCTHKCPVTGKKYRKALKKMTPEQFMSGAKIEYEMQEITHAIKNADMEIIPHPFGKPKSGERVIMIDHMSDKVRRMIELQNAGDDIVSEMIKGGHFKIDNTVLTRKGPKGVDFVPVKFRNNRK